MKYSDVFLFMYSRLHRPAINILLLIILLGGQIPAWGQFPTPGRPGFDNFDDPNSFQDSLPQQEVELDTFKIFRYYAGAPYREIPFSDSLLSLYTQQQDPARQRAYDYRNLGVDGSALQPLVYQPGWRRGFDVGFHQFDLYGLQTDSMPFYRIERPYTNAEYTRGGDQANAIFSLQFSRNFAQGINLALDYRRIAQLADRIQFPNQQNRNTSFGVGLTLQSGNQRYKGYLAFVTNKFEHDDNGGIISEPTLEGNFATPASAAVNLLNAGTRHRTAGYRYTHYLRLGRRDSISGAFSFRPPPPASSVQPPGIPGNLRGDSLAIDSLRRNYYQRLRPNPIPPNPGGIFNQIVQIGHSIAYTNSSYKFFDSSPAEDASFYRQFQTDDRGIRHFIQHRQLENRIFLLTYKPEKTNSNEPRQSRGLLELGIVHTLNWLHQEPVDSTINNLFATGKWHFLPSNFLRLETYVHLGLLDNIGDYRAEGKLQLKLGKVGQLEGRFISQLYEPNTIQKRLYVSQQLVWRNALDKTLETSLQASYSIPSFHLSVGGGYHLINNFIYYDSNGVARQSGVPLSILQLMVRKTFNVGKFHLYNQLVFQTSSEDFIRLPGIFGKHSLYFEGRLFKVLDTRLGFDLRYTTSYYSDTYHPLIGSFRLQDEQEVGFYPSVDAYASIRVTKFRAFVKLENATNLIPNYDRLYYTTAFYPYVAPASGLRIGIKWRFTE